MHMSLWKHAIVYSRYFIRVVKFAFENMLKEAVGVG
jgi:hypothetical protein